MKTNVRSHQFRTGVHDVGYTENGLDGYCEIPHTRPEICILSGKTQKALHIALHEAMHAEGIPDKFLDEEWDSSKALAKFLWRLGWRKKK